MLNLSPSVLISRLLILVIALTFHEFMHAVVADRLGDDTPRRMGRLNLNPLSHLDPLGSLMLIVVGFGWAKPVQVNPANLKRNFSAGMMWVSTGRTGCKFHSRHPGRRSPALESCSAHRWNRDPPLGRRVPFYNFITINLLLMIFNLIPLAPLDGEKFLNSFFPPAGQQGMPASNPSDP